MVRSSLSTKQSRRLSRLFAFLTFLLILFKPTPVVVLGYFGAKIGDVFIILCSIAAIVFAAPIGRVLTSRCPIALCALLSLLILEIASALYGLLSDLPTDIFDSVLFLNWFNLIILYFFGISIASRFREELMWKLIMIILMFCAFSWLLFFNIGNIKALSSVIFDYGKSRGIENSASHLGLFRLASTFGNPNYFGLFCAYLAALGIYFSVTRHDKFWSVFIFTVSATLLTLLSGSRTALLSFIIASAGALYFSWVDISRKKKIYALCFLVCVIIPFGSYFGGTYILQNLEKLDRLNDFENMRDSWYARTLVWQNLSDLNTSVYRTLFGIGSHERYTGNLDSQYVATAYRTGLLGFSCFICLFVWAFGVGGRLRTRSENAAEKGIAVSVQILAIVMAVGSITTQNLSHFQMASMFIIQLAMVEKLAHS